jgi:hypothetical protein
VIYVDEIGRRIKAVVATDDLPDGDSDLLFRIYAVLLLAKGSDVTSEDVHNAWVAWMTGKDKDHEALVRFSDLPADTRAEDTPFAKAIRTVARELGR